MQVIGDKTQTIDARYGVVAIGRNEEQGVLNCLKSIQTQSLKAGKIIFVNDGSTDKTKEIAQSINGIDVVDFGEDHESWVDSENLAKVVNKGILEIGMDRSFNFIITMGGDTILPPNYAEEIISKMIKHPEVVVAGGIVNGEYSHVPRGTARVTNLDYWRKIGLGYRVQVGFEGYHLYKAGSMGLSYRVFPINTTSPRPTGQNYSSKHWYREGYACKALGYYFPYMVGKSLILAKKSPKASFKFIQGYFANRSDLYEPEVRKYVKGVQKNLILHGKRS